MDATANIMVRDEAYWIGHVLTSAVNVFERLIVCDTGSTDGTLEIVRDVLAPAGERAKLLTFQPQTGAGLTRIRQLMAEMTETPWLMLIDGDEWYPEATLCEALAYDPPGGARLGYLALNVLREQGGRLWRAERFQKEAFFYADGLRWVNAYPFEHSDWEAHPRFYVPDGPAPAYDFHHLPRSVNDEAIKAIHRRGTRALTSLIEPVILPLDLRRWPNPYQEAEGSVWVSPSPAG